MKKIVLPLFLFFALIAYAEPNLSGTWKLDADASSGPPPAKGASLLVITQSGNDLTFDYYGASNGQRGDLIESNNYVLDGIEHRGNKTRTYITFVRAYWQKKALIVRTRAILDSVGEQTFTDEQRWSVSDDGKTLIGKFSDGTKTVWERQPEK
jgi:hypothetical protein